MRKLVRNRCKCYCISFAILLFSNALRAQTGSIQVTVKARHFDSLENATIKLLALPDTLLLQTQVSRRTHNTFYVKPGMSYLIKVSAIGFQTMEQVVFVQNSPVIIALELTEKRNMLKEVTIVSKK